MCTYWVSCVLDANAHGRDPRSASLLAEKNCVHVVCDTAAHTTNNLRTPMLHAGPITLGSCIEWHRHVMIFGLCLNPFVPRLRYQHRFLGASRAQMGRWLVSYSSGFGHGSFHFPQRINISIYVKGACFTAPKTQGQCQLLTLKALEVCRGPSKLVGFGEGHRGFVVCPLPSCS